jgi:rod shape determining protein RodA
MKKTLRETVSYGDFVTAALYLALLIFGALMVRSATFGTRFAYLGNRQMFWAVLAFGAFSLAFLIPYEIWVEYSYLLYGLCVAVLLSMPLLGHYVGGHKSWLYIGPIGFEPSEFAKVAAALAGAAFIKELVGRAMGWREIGILSAIIGLPMLLTLLQPDFGTATTFFPLLAVALYLSFLPLTQIVKWCALGILALMLLLALGWFTFLKPYQKDRIITFIHPTANTRGAGYQVNQARIAVGSGELLGKGLYSGTQNRLNFLPAPHTDFIFGVVAEETGFLGSLALLGLYLSLLLRFLSTASAARDSEGRFIVLCAFAVILYHVLINIGMVIGLVPTTGIPLPFLSYGGSFLGSMSLFVGLAANVRSRRYAQ